MPTSGPILWQLSQMWIGPTYAGGQYYYITYPGPDATQPSYQAVKSAPPSMSGLPPGWTGWNTLTLQPPWTGTLRWRVIDNGTTLQIDGYFTYTTGLPAGSQTVIAILPSALIALLSLPKNAIIMTNNGITGASALMEIQISPTQGAIAITPQGQTLTTGYIQQMYALNSPYNETVLGNFGTLTAAQAACQNDVNPPIPLGLHAVLPT